jgi:chromosome segregation ATPase
LDQFIINYDFDKEGDREYHQIIGNGFTILDEYSLELLSQKILARGLIIQNELVNGEDKGYEAKINNLASQFQKADKMFLNYPLELIQREVWKKIKGEKDLGKEFQNKLQELEKILIAEDEIIATAPNLEQIKNKINELKFTIQRQSQQITQLRQDQAEKISTINSLNSSYERLSSTVETKIKGLEKDLGEKIKSLEIAEFSARESRELLTKCEKDYKKKVHNLSNSLTSETETNQKLANLLNEKDQYITDLRTTIEELEENKEKIEKDLEARQKLNNQLTDRVNKLEKYKK